MIQTAMYYLHQYAVVYPLLDANEATATSSSAPATQPEEVISAKVSIESVEVE